VFSIFITSERLNDKTGVNSCGHCGAKGQMLQPLSHIEIISKPNTQREKARAAMKD